MAQERTQRTDLLVRPERGPEEPHRVQVLEPRAIGNIRPPSRNVLVVSRIDQAYFESVRFQNLK
jgi:hypothetical protein